MVKRIPPLTLLFKSMQDSRPLQDLQRPLQSFPPRRKYPFQVLEAELPAKNGRNLRDALRIAKAIKSLH